VTPVDHRKPPTHGGPRRHKAPPRRSEPPRREDSARRGDAPARRVQRSHSAVGAAIVAVAALAAVFAFILTRGSTTSPDSGDGLRLGTGLASGAAAPSAPVATDDATKADRKPPASTTSKPATKTAPPVDTGATSPVFKRGQWIAVLDKYDADGVDAEQLAKAAAIRVIKAGVPAKAMLVDGQYPGFANSSMEPVTDTWVLYLGPGTSSAQMLNFCSAPKTQRAYGNPACPTYEPAVAPGS
jgi:hypothetical protein